LGIGFDTNASNNPEKPYWIGVSASYLVKRQGELFEKNSFTVGISRTFRERIKVEPKLYFNDFFKNAYPSLKIGVTF
jgi:hypothetical protein